jgi:hypothetical protein
MNLVNHKLRLSHPYIFILFNPPFLLFIYRLNGIYDIICGLSMLFFNVPVITNLHMSMIKEKYRNHNIQRYFGYWIFTYGCMRLFGNYTIIFISYILEILFLFNEYRLNMLNHKSIYVILLSVIFALSVINLLPI